MDDDQTDDFETKDTILDALLVGGIAIGGAIVAVTQGVQSVLA